jgi:hypothetical protein
VPDSDGSGREDERHSPNATDDETTPSQYKKMRREDVDHEEKAEESDDDPVKANDPEAVLLPEAGHHAVAIDRDAALKIDCHDLLRRFEHMGAQLKAIINVQKEEQAIKRARDSEMPAPAPKRPAPFTPPRKAPISVQPTQETRSETRSDEDSDLDEFADDDDSVFSQSSYKTPRKKLQANWRFLGVRHNAESSPQQIQAWLHETAAVEMAKAGPIETARPGKYEIGGFRRAHVSDTILFTMCC